MLNFEDIRIVPRPTTISSRTQCDTTATLGPFTLQVPLIVASMHSLVTPRMISYVEGFGSVVVQPREMTYLNANYLALSTGLDSALVRAADLHRREGIISLEIANGYQHRMLGTLKRLKETYPETFVMAGTVCDLAGFDMLSDYADAVLMGIGVGNACTTTVNTGVGLPAAEMLYRLQNTGIDRTIVLCGGIKTYGDFVKAIALGADVVMSGYLFKDCVETGERYYGEASQHQKSELAYIEGREIQVAKGRKTSFDVLTEAKQALQSAMSYCDACTLAEFRAKVNLTW